MIGAACLIALALGSMVASVIFHFMLGLDPEGARPWSTVPYWSAAGDDRVGNALFASYLLGGGLAIGMICVMFVGRAPKLFGDYRFARLSDVRRAGMLKDDGHALFLGRFQGGRNLFFSGQEFVMVKAPTRSGKGVAIVVPNLLQFPDSAVCLDIKFENFELTSGCRRHYGQEVYLFAPGSAEYRTHRQNPLGYISRDPNHRLNDIDKIVMYLLPTPPNVDPMWSTEGRALMKAVILLVLDTPNTPNSLGEVLRQLRTEMPSNEYFKEVIAERGETLDPECVRGLSNYIHMPAKTAGGIKTTVTAALNAWANPLVDAATEASDFDLRQLRKRRMTLYLGVSQDDLQTFAPVFSLLVQQIIGLNTQKDDLPARYNRKGKLISGNPEIKYQCLLLLDEFCALGRMASIAKAVSFIAGYNLRLMPIFQSEAQLIDTYGQHAAENIIENHAVHIIFRPNRRKQAQVLSDEIGYTTAKQESLTKQRNFSGWGSKNESQARRALMLPEEIMGMKDDDQVIQSRRCPYPIYAKKVAYMNDKDFAARIKAPVEIPRITPAAYPVRGRVESGPDVQSARPVSNRTLSELEIDQAVESLFGAIED